MPAMHINQSLYDLGTAIGSIKISGLELSLVNNTFNFTISAGVLFSFGCNYNNNIKNPNNKSFA